MRKSMAQMIVAIIKKAGMTNSKETRDMVEDYIKGYKRCMPPELPDEIIIDGVAQSFSYH